MSDLWAWLDADDPAPVRERIDPASVTAVMVTHNAHPWLAHQLLALARLDPRPGHIIAVDNASTDDTPALLERGRGEGILDVVLHRPTNGSFGDAVREGLEGHHPAWVWLLHDDSAPRPGTLEALLDGAVRTGAAIVVPKLLQPRRRNYPELLSEAGVSISRGGARVSSVEDGDIDQHQLEAHPVLGGSTAGMLVRGDVWRDLDGLAPELSQHRDGVDLGWRANQAGHLVTTWPQAALTHRRAGRTAQRIPTTPASAHETDRVAALRLVAARGPRTASGPLLVLSSVLRAAGFLVGKSPSLAAAELRAARRFAATPELTSALAARDAGDDDRVAALLPGRFWTVRHGLDALGAGVLDRYRDLTSGGGTSLDELTGDDFAGASPAPRRWLSPVVLLLLALVVVGVVAARSLWGATDVAGGGLLPAPSSLEAAWEGYLRPTVGVSGGNAPWLLFAAVSSTIAIASPSALALAVLVLAPALAGGAAFLWLRELRLDVGHAAAGSGVWAGALVLLGVVGAGDLSGMALAVTGPLLARSIHRLVTDESTGAERLRSPAAVAFWLVLCSAAWPLLLPMSTVAAVIWAVLDGDRRRDAVIAVGLPWLFMAPWLPTLVRWPGRLLTGADPLAWPAFPPAGYALLAGRLFPSAVPPFVNVVFFGALASLAALGLARSRGPHQRWLVAAVALPLVAGISCSRLALDVHGGQARALLSGWALLVLAALLVAALQPAVEDAGQPRPRTAPIAATLALLGVFAGATWGWVGMTGMVGASPSLLPGYVRDVVASKRDTRVLMLEASGGLAWNVVSSRAPQWGSGERPLGGAFADELEPLVRSIARGAAPEGLARDLTNRGISHVYMGGFDEEDVAALGDAPGLTRAAVRDGDVVWSVGGLPSRARIVGSQTSAPIVDGTLEAASGLRHLMLAEDADPRWWARVGGVDLAVSPDRPPVSFTVPAGVGGDVEWGLRGTWGVLGWQCFVALVIMALVAPTLGSTTAARRGRP